MLRWMVEGLRKRRELNPKINVKFPNCNEIVERQTREFIERNRKRQRCEKMDDIARFIDKFLVKTKTRKQDMLSINDMLAKAQKGKGKSKMTRYSFDKLI